MNISQDTLIYDIETRVFGLPDPKRDILKIFGCYSYKTNKYYLITNIEQMKTVINSHKYLVGFNNKAYDNPILERSGVSLKYKIIIDLMEVFKKRAGAMKIDKGMLGNLLMSYSLDFISKTIGVVDEKDGKIEIDYKKFQKDVWTEEELKEISIYTKRDLEVTKKMYEWLENYFESFKSFVYDKDIENKSYLTCTTASFAYKAICKEMGWKEEYNDNKEIDEERIGGGYVSYPAGERFEDNIYCFDFASLYPSIMIQCNLHNRKKENESNDRPIWNGNGVWKTEGSYYSDKLGGIGELFKKWYNDRVVFKKAKDRREYTIKIALNSSYGVTDNPSFKHIFDKVAAGDCTRIGRQWIKYVRRKLREKGYKMIYSDTDSVYLQDTYKDKDKLLKEINEIIDYIRSTVPFPQDFFGMALEAEIKYMFFFKGGNEKEMDGDMDEDDFLNRSLGLMSKNYIYITKDNKVVIKNLGLNKKSNSGLSKKIFWDYLVPEMIKTGNCKFSKAYIQELITKLLKEDITLASMRKEVSIFKDYEEKSPTCLSAQISKKWGSGIHFLITNNKGWGVGKGKSYCTVDEFKEHKGTINDIDLSNVWDELDYFIKPQITKNIFEFG